MGISFARDYGGLGALLSCMGSSESAEAKKQAALATESLLAQLPLEYRAAVAEAIGEEHCAALLADPAGFSEALTQSDQLARQIAAAVAPGRALLSPAQGLDEADLWDLPPMPATSFGLVAAAAEEEEEEEEGEEEEQEENNNTR